MGVRGRPEALLFRPPALLLLLLLMLFWGRSGRFRCLCPSGDGGGGDGGGGGSGQGGVEVEAVVEVGGGDVVHWAMEISSPWCNAGTITAPGRDPDWSPGGGAC